MLSLRVIVAFLTVGCCLLSHAQETEASKAESKAISKVKRAFLQAVGSGDLKAARTHVATLSGISEAEVMANIENLSRGMKEGAVKDVEAGTARESKAINDCGFSVVQGKSKVRPYYLIKQNGEWKLLPVWHFYGFEKHQLTDGQKDAFLLLHSYFVEKHERSR